MKKAFLVIIKRLLILFSPVTLFASAWLLLVKKVGTGTTGYYIFRKLGIFPILDNYYQPLVNPKKHLKNLAWNDRKLNGINLNLDEQLKIIDQFNYQDELLKFPITRNNSNEYYYKLI